MTETDPLPPLREVIAAHGLQARKELGQNFLLDLNLTRRIARASGQGLEAACVIEVGPGPGGLTRALLMEGARKVIAIERDARALPVLEEVSAAYPGRLEIIHGDALQIDYAKLCDGPTRIVANLPYNIATPLLTGWVETQTWPPYFESLTLMFQKEVAERICATPKSKAFGRLAVLCGWRTAANIQFHISPSAFTPPPKVTSSLVHLMPRADARVLKPGLLADVTRAAFGQRRKMVRQSLKSLGVELAPLLGAANLKGVERAEELDIGQFLALAAYVQSARASS